MAIVLVLMAFLFLSILLTAGLLSGGHEPRTVSDGQRLLDAGEAQAARKVFERLARQRSPNAPGREPALFWLGRTLEELGRFDDARRVYLKYLQDYDGPGSTARATPQVLSRVRERLAELLRGTPETSQSAWASFNREQGAVPDAEPPRGLPDARRLMEVGRFDPARRVLERLVDDPTTAEPTRENALWLMGLAHEGLGKPDEALRAYRRYQAEYGPAAARRATPRILSQVEQRSAELAAELERDGSAWSRFQRDEQRGKSARRVVVDGAPARAPEPEREPPTPRSPDEVRRDLERLDVGIRVGEYVLAEKLGEGGMGEVFRALLPVAIKFARTPEAVEHLRRFGALQSQIKSSRIVKPLRVDLDADPPYVVMEYVDGPTLRELLRLHDRLDPVVALHVLLEVARGLKDAHLAGVLHLDLKPENVLLDESGSVKLTDFELGRLQGEAAQLRLSLSFRSAEGEALAGTLAYMSPEQRAGKVPDVRSDLYTFGVILFEALTGTLPEPGDRPSDFVEDLPPEVDAVFERCFARLERRYVDAGELVRDLERVVLALPVRADLARVFAEVPRVEHEGAAPRLLRGTEPRQRADVAQFERALRAAIERAAPEGVAEPASAAEPAAPDVSDEPATEQAADAPASEAPAATDDLQPEPEPTLAPVDPPALVSPEPVEAPPPPEPPAPPGPLADEAAPPADEGAVPAAHDARRPLRRPDLDSLLASRRAGEVERPVAEPE
ncbi:MAG: protein kinase [Planctomycetes bacterium]|nr:protein kinase [Planctomycetota bacterium]